MNDDATSKKGLSKYLKNFDYYLAVVGIIFVAVYCFSAVLTRYFLGKTSATLDELNMIVFIWMLYASITYCVRLDKHIRVEVFDLYLPKKYSTILKIIADGIWFVFSLYLTFASFRLISFNLKYIARTPMLDIPMFLVYSILPLAFVSMSIFLAMNITKRIKGLKTEEKEI